MISVKSGLSGRILLVLLLALACFSESCYTLNGVSISPDTNTFYVEQFDVTALEAPQEIGQLFSEQLKRRINNDSRLVLTDTDPDVDFSGAISRFSVTPEAPNPDRFSSLNRLTIAVTVTFVNTKTPANNYTQTFEDFETFAAEVNLLDVQEELIAIIYERITENAFNRAFSNW